MKRIYLIGFMGSGKTTIGKLLAEKLDLGFIDLDFFIEKRYLKSISDIFKEKGEKTFREIEKKCLEEISAFENVVIATGGGTPCQFNNIKTMNNTGTTFYLYFNEKSLAERLELTNKKTRPLITLFSKEELLEYIKKTLSEREIFYNQANYKVQGTDKELIKQIIELVNKK